MLEIGSYSAIWETLLGLQLLVENVSGNRIFVNIPGSFLMWLNASEYASGNNIFTNIPGSTLTWFIEYLNFVLRNMEN